MLRIANRVQNNQHQTNLQSSNPNSSTNNQRGNAKKQDHLDLLNLIEKCTQILRDDKILLRTALKEHQNQKLIDVLKNFKKKPTEDLGELQIELRKLVNELKGKRTISSPERDFKKKPQIIIATKENNNNQCMSPAARIHSNSKKTPHEENDQQNKTYERSVTQNIAVVPVQAPSLQIFQDTVSEKKEINETISDQKEMNQTISDQKDMIKSTCSQNQIDVDPLQFMTIVSQTPHQSILKDRNNTEHIENTSEEVVLKYNVEEINAFRGQEKLSFQDDQKFTQKKLNFDIQGDEMIVCPHCGQSRDDNSVQSIAVFPQIIPEIQSLHFREYAQVQNRHMFTDWSLLLKNSDRPQYQFTEKTQLESCQMVLRISGISADTMFSIIFPNSFTHKVNLYQMKANITKVIPNNEELDIETIFKMCDQDCDGWVSPVDVGETLQQICLNSDLSEEFLLIEKLMDGVRQLKLDNLELFLQNQLEQGNIQDYEIDHLGRRLFEEIDLDFKGYLTKWEIYQNKQLQQVKRLIELLL